MSWRRVAVRLAHSVSVGVIMVACTAIPPEPAESTPVAPAAPSGASAPPHSLRPLASQPALPPGAPPRSQVPSVLYDLSVSGAGELTPDDGVPGDDGPRDIFERGGASWYGIQFHQRKTANGERFDMSALTAAHRTLPFNTRVCVRSLVNGREVLVRINDRGPYASGRIIDLSRAAAEAIGMLGLGIKQVALSIMDRNMGRCGDLAVDALPEPSPARFEPAPRPPERKIKEVPPRLRR